jgi:hypothetical protein
MSEVYSLVRADGKASIECTGLEVGKWYDSTSGIYGIKSGEKYQFRKYANLDEWCEKVL